MDDINNIYVNALSFPSILIENPSSDGCFILKCLFEINQNELLQEYIAIENAPQILGTDAIDQIDIKSEIIDPFRTELILVHG